ncbi:MAG: hypothetical protein GF365_00085 [Candidatus Buchananbacteria bacterium]|nr:hypothetical protein [Candidatus Buchananbacteria bacterium]
MSKKILIIISIVIILIIIVAIIYWFTLPAETTVVTMQEFNNSNQFGSTALVPENNKTRIIINLANSPNYPQQAYILEGSCEQPGDVIYTLSPLINGKSETVIDLSLKKLFNKLPLTIAVYRETPATQVNVSCGSILTP